MPEGIFERDRNENTDDENYQVIAKFVSLLRSQGNSHRCHDGHFR